MPSYSMAYNTMLQYILFAEFLKLFEFDVFHSTIVAADKVIKQRILVILSNRD